MAYGPEAIVVALVAAGTAALHLTLPIAVAIAVLLGVLVISYRQVIAVHPDGGGAYAVAKSDLTRPIALLAAASLIVDYTLTVAVSLAAGAAGAHRGAALAQRRRRRDVAVPPAHLTWAQVFGAQVLSAQVLRDELLSDQAMSGARRGR